MKLTDGQLLERFIENREEHALELLVKRYSSLVLGVCRRLLQNSHEAEKAFEATFITLVRKASELQKNQMLGAWLYETSIHTANHFKNTILSKSHDGAPPTTEETSLDTLIHTTVKAAAATLIGIQASTFSISILGTIKQLLQHSLYHKVIFTSASIILTLGIVTIALPYRSNFKHPISKASSASTKAFVPTNESTLKNQGYPLNKIDLPLSLSEYMMQFKAALTIENQTQRWTELRNLGLNLSNQDYIKAETQAFQSWASELGLSHLLSQSPTEAQLLQAYMEANGEDWKVNHWRFLRDRFYHASIFSKWTEASPESAATWAYQLQNLTEDFVTELPTYACTHSSISSQLKSRQTDTPSQVEFFQQIMTQWTLQNSESARIWINSLPSGRGRDVAIETITRMTTSQASEVRF